MMKVKVKIKETKEGDIKRFEPMLSVPVTFYNAVYDLENGYVIMEIDEKDLDKIRQDIIEIVQ